MGQPAFYELNLEMFSGTDRVFIIPVLDASGQTVGDISSWPVSFMAKSKLTLPDDSAELYETSGGNCVPLADGTVRVKLADAKTDALGGKVLRWEIKRRSEGSEVVMVGGELTIHQAVHRA